MNSPNTSALNKVSAPNSNCLALNSISLDIIEKQYRLRNCEPHILSNRWVQKLRSELTGTFNQLAFLSPTVQNLDRSSPLAQRLVSFTNDPSYSGALKFLQDEYYEFNTAQESHWNVPHSRYLPHQTPGAPRPPLGSPQLFPAEIELTGEGVCIKVFTSGFAKCRIERNEMTDIRVEGCGNMIRMVVVIEEAQENCAQQSYVGRQITRTYHLPDPIVNESLTCHFYEDISILMIQAPWCFQC